MRKVGTTAHLSWEDVVEGLASGRVLSLPEGVSKIALAAEALEEAQAWFDLEDEADEEYE